MSFFSSKIFKTLPVFFTIETQENQLKPTSPTLKIDNKLHEVLTDSLDENSTKKAVRHFMILAFLRLPHYKTKMIKQNLS